MALKIQKYQVILTLTEDLLGTVPKDPAVYKRFIADLGREEMEKAAKKGIPLASGEEPTEHDIATAVAEEVATVETAQEREERGWTGFHALEVKEEVDGKSGIKRHFLYDYSLKGFLSEAARTLKQWSPDSDEESEAEDAKAIKQLQDKIKRYVFVFPRRILLPEVAATPLERPLRAATAQGPRVALTRSDVIPAGGQIRFQLHVLAGAVTAGSFLPEALLRDLFSYGAYCGLGQWRSGGYGRITLEDLCKIK